MKNFYRVAAVVFIAVFATGCANSQLQADVDELKAQMKEVSAQAAAAEEAANSAQAAANSAEQTANDTSSKLDRMFKKSMMK